LEATLKPLLQSELKSISTIQVKEIEVELFISDNKCDQLFGGMGNGDFSCDKCNSARAGFCDYAHQHSAAVRDYVKTATRVTTGFANVLSLGDSNPALLFPISSSMRSEWFHTFFTHFSSNHRAPSFADFLFSGSLPRGQGNAERYVMLPKRN